jgi:hypothetical protein
MTKNSLISQSVPNMQALTSHTANTSERAIPTPSKNDQQARKKRKPGSGRLKGSKSTVAPEDRPHRLGRSPGTGRLQRADMPRPEERPLGQMQLPKPAVSDESRPFNLVCVFNRFIMFTCANSLIVRPRDTEYNTRHPYDMGLHSIGPIGSRIPQSIPQCHTDYFEL